MSKDKNPAEMSLLELLEALAGDSSRYHELLPFIEQNAKVQRAMQKTTDWAVATSDGRHLDSLETVTYVRYLAGRFSLARTEMDDGRQPTTLTRIFGQEEKPMNNPFTE